MLMFGKYESIMILFEEPLKVAHCKKKEKIALWDAPIIKCCFVGMIIKGIYYIHLHLSPL
jgi:hypothetical protein